ncbi:MAG: pilus assembly protein TadG-related protein [Acidimicrobiia bacterium]|nr:pilus assembly protein TadG-related protein [Acidimicrobiia bacterium]MDH4308303.1 pilus assembly protein TadG-related protein [Acidimicrobiia bacterium]MDH5293940.1 pilus assembly protein TadG-related protein [Acidimicrobiia bacterium]
MIDRIVRFAREAERGATLAWVAGSMVALLAITAFAVDLGWYYLNAARLQRASDAAALAGVTWLPTSPANALQDAETAARVNDFAHATLTGNVLADNKFQVSMAVDVPTFFASVVGIETLPLSRTSTAEYIKPIKLGSPSNKFGDGTDSSTAFWASINGPETAKQQGDPFGTACWSNPYPDTTGVDPPGGCTVSNPEFRSGGYYYGVEVPAGVSSFNVAVMNGSFYAGGTLLSGTGDYALEESYYDGNPNDSRWNTTFTLYAPDATPTDPYDNSTVVCSRTFGTRYGSNPQSNDSTYWTDYNVCSSSASTATHGIGTYVMRVSTSTVSGYSGIGANQYRVRVDSVGGSSRLFGINDMSIYTNVSGGVSNIYLAEIPTIHAGKKLLINLYDPGEDNGNAYMTIRPPSGSVSCSYRAYNEAGSQTRSGNSSTCRIQTASSGSSYFQGNWVRINIDIPATYSCTTNCWWRIYIENSQSHDRTTWSAQVIGNPVRLVPNP